MRTRHALAAACAAGALALGAWGFWLEPDSLHLNQYDLPLQHWPAELSGLRVALIADLHIGAPWIDLAKVQRVVELTNAAHPDLVLLAGDFVGIQVPGARPIAPGIFAPVLGRLSAPLGVYAVLGNHDTLFGSARVGDALAAAGIRMMDDRAVELERGNGKFWLVGLAEFNQRPWRWEQVVEQVPAGAPMILFTHQPYLFKRLPARVNLMLAGHTHGGQINLLPVRLLLNPDIQQHLAGHYLEQTDLFVTRGIGTSIIPARINAPPEISLLTLRPAQ